MFIFKILSSYYEWDYSKNRRRKDAMFETTFQFAAFAIEIKINES